MRLVQIVPGYNSRSVTGRPSFKIREASTKRALFIFVKLSKWRRRIKAREGIHLIFFRQRPTLIWQSLFSMENDLMKLFKPLRKLEKPAKVLS